VAKLTPAQLYNLARDAGLNPTAAVVAAATALGESGGDPAAVGDVGLQTDKWGPSVGLWQIRSLKADHGTGRTRDATRLTDPAFNARAMATISGAGANWRPWSVFTSGKYRQHLDAVTTATGQPQHPRATPASGSGTANTYKDLPGLPDAVDRGVDAGVDAVTDALDWQADAYAVGLKLVLVLAAGALVVAGVRTTVSDS
jgi:hypothetical protein